MTVGAKASTSKSAALRRAPGRAKPSSSDASKEDIARGEKKMGNQPSAISAARATFLGPSAPKMMGTSARSGCTIGLSGLPSPVPPG